jgi:hypothetical protein
VNKFNKKLMYLDGSDVDDLNFEDSAFFHLLKTLWSSAHIGGCK